MPIKKFFRSPYAAEGPGKLSKAEQDGEEFVVDELLPVSRGSVPSTNLDQGHDHGGEPLLYELEGSTLHRRSDYYTRAFFLFSAPPPVTLQTKLNTTFLSLNEVGQHSVDIDLKSCRYDAKKEDMRIGMKENKAKEEELWDDLVFPIQKMEENLKHCKFAA